MMHTRIRVILRIGSRENLDQRIGMCGGEYEGADVGSLVYRSHRFGLFLSANKNRMSCLAESEVEQNLITGKRKRGYRKTVYIFLNLQ